MRVARRRGARKGACKEKNAPNPEPPLSPSPHANSFVIGTAEIKQQLVYAYVVDCTPASPYAYSASTHRFPDERTPIEATPLSATSAELPPFKDFVFIKDARGVCVIASGFSVQLCRFQNMYAL
jgi:hypothetical protein